MLAKTRQVKEMVDTWQRCDRNTVDIRMVVVIRNGIMEGLESRGASNFSTHSKHKC